MTSILPPAPGPGAGRRAQIGRTPALIGIGVACLVGVLLGGAAKSNASGPGPTSTVTTTRPAATVTVHSTSRSTVTATSTVTARVTSTRTITAAAARPAVSSASAPAAQDCTPGYSPCIPPGPDVDCAGGSGNGPRYVQGPVYVTGSDPYRLDADHDGIGCE